MQPDFLQILPRELAQTRKDFFREALRRAQLAGRAIPSQNDWPPTTPPELIELFEEWKSKNSNNTKDTDDSGSAAGGEQQQQEDRRDKIAWDPW